jgi:DNA-directed RNA polymerase specialized sigma24 family protein
VQAEQREAVLAAVDRLPDRQRSLITALFYGSASSYQALSTKLGMPPGSIGPTRDRALGRLRRDRRLASALQLKHHAGR